MENKYMLAALSLARRAEEINDVPVGAVVVKDGVIVGEGFNTRERENDVSGHAEINALKSAARTLGTWRLDGCDLYVTLEPCPMCAAAIAAARIDSLYFGAYDKKIGAVESAMRLFDFDFERKPRFYGGVMEEETSRLMKDFFNKKRKNKDGRS